MIDIRNIKGQILVERLAFIIIYLFNQYTLKRYPNVSMTTWMRELPSAFLPWLEEANLDKGKP